MATVSTRTSERFGGRSRLETVGFVFMRVSGVLLLFLALGHFAIQHVIHDVHDLSLGFVAERWSMVGWRVYDAFLLALALVHGLNGFNTVVDDYARRRKWRNRIRWAIIIAGAIWIVVGTFVIIRGVR